MVEEHDEFCHCRGILGVHGACCDCALIAKVRASALDSLLAANQRRVQEWDEFRAKVEALYGTGAYEEAIADVLALLDGANNDA